MPNLVVTGMSGLLGAEVGRLAMRQGWRVTGTHHRHPVVVGGAASVLLDVRDAAAVADLIDRVRPDAIVHTAYVQHGSERDATIVAGTAHVATAARLRGVRLVHMSTDLVFAGRDRPYTVDDVPDPVDGYGRCKARAEELVRAVDRSVVVRSSLLYSVERPCPAVRMVLDAGAATRFFVDEFRTPTLVEELAAGLVGLAAGETVGIVHLSAADVVSRYEFARLVAARYGRAPESIIPGSRLDHPAPRPGRVALTSSVPGYRGAREVLTPR